MEDVQDATREFIFSSPELPPPFSTTSRRVSDAVPVLSTGLSNNGMYVSPGASQVTSTDLSNPEMRSPGASPIRSVDLSNFETHGSDTSGGAGRDSVNLSPRMNDNEIRFSSSQRTPQFNDTETGFRPSPMGFLRSAARIVSYYRPRSPSAASPPSLRAQSLRSRHQTPSRYLTVYNDSLPPQTQPQTPAQLPESRHRSRYHPAYTAPVTRATGRNWFGVGNNDRLPSQYQVPPTTPSRRARVSPIGLQSAGMRGLYGGRENGDEEESWVEGVRFSNAEVRLWGLRDAAGDGQTLGDTPEREEWAIGRH